MVSACPFALRPPQNIVTYLKVNYAGRPIYQIGISFFKIALLIGYLRLLQGTSNKAYRGAIWCTIAFVSVSHVGSSISFVALRLSAGKIEKSWKPGRPGTCLPVDASFTVYSILTIVSDVIVAVLVCAFMLGLFTTLCSLFRYTQIKRIQLSDGNSTMLGCVGRDRIPRGHDYIIAALSGTGLPTRGQGALLQAKAGTTVAPEAVTEHLVVLVARQP
ncbi:hypothetical protein ARSEF1564_009887 [Beauveria bassiana]